VARAFPHPRFEFEKQVRALGLQDGTQALAASLTGVDSVGATAAMSLEEMGRHLLAQEKLRQLCRVGSISNTEASSGDLVCYRLLDVVVAISDPQGDAGLFERDTQDA